MGRSLPIEARSTESIVDESSTIGSHQPFLFLVLEAARPVAGSARFDLRGVDEVRLGRGDTRAAQRSEIDGARVLELFCPDRRMSAEHARLARIGGRWVIEDLGSKNGVRVGGERVTRHGLAPGELIETGGTFWSLLPERCAAPAPADADSDSTPEAGSLLPGLSHEIERLMAVARSDVTVVLQGPTGSGKEVLARALHDESGRSGRFVAVNCGALPATLVESELFGHKRGAFSGATEDRQGWVKSADRGTLLLDEIGDLPLAAQAALLRVLQQQEVVPVGSREPVRVDVRVVAATHRDLDQMVLDGTFRADLLSRLRGFRFVLPPLRDRRAEIGHLVRALVRRMSGAAREPLELSIEAARALAAYEWPANVRELEQALRAAHALSLGSTLAVEHLPPQICAKKLARATTSELSDEDLELKARVAALLEEHGGNVSAVARVMGKERKQIRRWIERFGLRAASD